MQLTMASLGACQTSSIAAEARRGLQQQRAAARPRAAVVVRASSLDSKGLFSTNSSLLGPKPNLSGPSTSLSGPGPATTSKPQPTVDEVELASGVSARFGSLCMPRKQLPHRVHPPTRYLCTETCTLPVSAVHEASQRRCHAPRRPTIASPPPTPPLSVSQVDVDYSKLRDLLKEGKWREAEDETRELLIQAAGPAAVRRGWVYFSEVKFIPGGFSGRGCSIEQPQGTAAVLSSAAMHCKLKRQPPLPSPRLWGPHLLSCPESCPPTPPPP